MKFPPFLYLCAALCLNLTSCVHIFTKSDTYDTSQTNVVNGATVTTSMMPKDASSGLSLSAMVYMAATAKQKGPFAWRIEAEGLKGQHTSMTVHRLKVETAKTERKGWLANKRLGKKVKFVSYDKEPSKAFAIYPVPGELRVLSEQDGDIRILADITISTKKKSVRKLVAFDLKAELGKRESEFVSIPTELINSFGEPDPREWPLQ